MKKLKENRSLLTVITCVLVALHPVIELDYLLGDMPLPRLTTLVDLVILPLLVLLTFLAYEKRKKRILLLALLVGVPFLAYFVVHCYKANLLQYEIRLPTNFVFLLKDEVVYTYTLVVPMIMVYIFHHQEIHEEILKRTVLTLSAVVAVPIFLGNVFVFGLSTYQGRTVDCFLSWFSLPFDAFDHHPRLYAGKFFFEEGNTVGVLLLMILPLLYYFCYKSHSRKEKWRIGLLIAIQSVAMIILSTRVAAYGAILVPAAVFVIWGILMALRSEKFKASFLALLLVMGGMSAVILPFSPAYQNQLLDAQDYRFIKQDDSKRDSARETLRRGADGLEPYSKEWLDFYTFMFEEYAFLMNVTPPIYYQEWYDYRQDPKFWVDLIFDYELEERVSGRQIENIFTRYKYDPLPVGQKVFGLGYGTFMRGSILIEQDFKQQYYSYGLIGFLFVQLPWLLLFAAATFLFLTGYRKKRWHFRNILLLMSCAMAFLAAYASGHVLDELSTSLLLALFLGYYFKGEAYEN